MADEADIANDEVQRSLDIALGARPKCPTTPHEGPCIACGEEVEPQRAALGYGMCIECATTREYLTRGRA